MSHSTTATSTYVLSKYSKLYQSSSSVQAEQCPPHARSDNPAEWQHFIHPVIRLILDVKKSSDSVLESVRLRVLWSMDSGDTSMNMVDRREVVLEDLELLSFSRLPPPQTVQKPSWQGLPLKAVYRGPIVGIRYLYPSISAVDSGTTSTYRRFQITFTSASAASLFIDAIRGVCPCKSNPNPAQRPGAAMTTDPVPHVSGAGVHTAVANASTLHCSLQNHSDLFARAPIPTTLCLSPKSHPTMKTGTQGRRPDFPSSPYSILPSSKNCERKKKKISPLNLGSRPRRPSSSPITTFSTQTSDIMNSTHRMRNHSQLTDEQDTDLSQITMGRPLQNSMVPLRRLSQSSPSVIGQNSTTYPPPPTPDLHDSVSHSQDDPFISSVRKTTLLYDLPQDMLEYLICNVVREEGFIELLEKVSSMWKVKCILER